MNTDIAHTETMDRGITPDDASKGGDTIPSMGSRSRVSKTSQYIYVTVQPDQVQGSMGASDLLAFKKRSLGL
jgi:hypothetical protein